MKYITIKRDLPFISLVFLLNRSPELLIEEILTNAQKDDIIIDELETMAGNLLVDQFTITDLFNKESACVRCLNTSDKEVVGLFCKLTLWGFGDCPECGCESEESEEHPNQYIQIGYDSPPELAGYDNRVCLHCNHEFQI